MWLLTMSIHIHSLSLTYSSITSWLHLVYNLTFSLLLAYCICLDQSIMIRWRYLQACRWCMTNEHEGESPHIILSITLSIIPSFLGRSHIYFLPSRSITHIYPLPNKSWRIRLLDDGLPGSPYTTLYYPLSPFFSVFLMYIPWTTHMKHEGYVC